MNSRNKTIALALSIGLSTSLAPAALAGKAVVTSAEGDESVFEYQGDMLRINTADDSNYAVLRDGNFYTVMQDNGRTMVIDAGSMMQAFGGMAQGANPGDLAVKVLSMKKTGARETVAGIKGEVYELRFEDENGDKRTEELVLSDDRRVRELRDALFLMLETFSKNTSMGDPENAKDMLGRLEDLDSGVLRFGDDLIISNISDDRIDDDRFNLPAPPMNLQGLGNMLGGMNQSTNQSTNKPSYNDARVGDGVEEEIDAETDEEADTAINKAFKKLFGN